MNSNMENLFCSASESDDASVIEELLTAVKAQADLSSEEIVSGIDFLLEGWGASIESSPLKSQFCLDLAMLGPSDSPVIRISLQRAFNCLKTSPFMKSSVVKAVGLRDEKITIKQIAERFNTLEKLGAETVIFNPESRRFGVVEALDEITSEIVVKWSTASTSTTMSLKRALNDLIFLESLPVIPVKGKKIDVSLSDWKESAEKSFISDVDDSLQRQIALCLVADSGISSDLFEVWWNTSEEGAVKVTARHPSTARTIHELNTLLLEYEGSEFSDEEQNVLTETFHNLRLNSKPENMQMLAESLAMLKQYIPEDRLVKLGEEVKVQVVFWPEPVDNAGDKLVAWEKLSAKYLPIIAQLTIDIFSDEYMASLLLQLSYRCWNSILPVLDIKVLASSIENASFLPADAILWVWKNRNKLPETTVATISPQALRKALDAKNSSPAVQDIKSLFIDDRVFQEKLIERIAGNEMELLRAIQACDNMRMDEKQSLLVKCSSISSAIKHHIEKGEGKKMFAAAGRKHIEKQSEDAADITSLYSFNKMMDTLNDIINKQIPENSAAIAHARSYGDLKENAEYKAAKEQQAYLQSRRDEIETAILRTQAVDFSLQEVGDIVIPGSTVTIKYSHNGEKETFHLLGVWDGDPENNCISYTSALGKALNGRVLNDEVEMPDKCNAVISKIEKLPEELLDKLNAE